MHCADIPVGQVGAKESDVDCIRSGLQMHLIE